MEFNEAKKRFISAWGTLGTNWGVNKTMAQIHALLLLSPCALSPEEIMDELNISRGNASMNIRALIDWGIIHKELKPGERKEYFTSEKDIWHLAKQIARERRRREIEPVRRLLTQVADAKGKHSEELKEFKKVTKDIDDFVGKLDLALEKFIVSDQHWFFGTLLKLVK